jgi:hypothetical protein
VHSQVYAWDLDVYRDPVWISALSVNERAELDLTVANGGVWQPPKEERYFPCVTGNKLRLTLLKTNNFNFGKSQHDSSVFHVSAVLTLQHVNLWLCCCSTDRGGFAQPRVPAVLPCFLPCILTGKMCADDVFSRWLCMATSSQRNQRASSTAAMGARACSWSRRVVNVSRNGDGGVSPAHWT